MEYFYDTFCSFCGLKAPVPSTFIVYNNATFLCIKIELLLSKT